MGTPDRSIEVGAAAVKLVKRHRVARREAGRAATATRLQPHHRRARGRGARDSESRSTADLRAERSALDAQIARAEQRDVTKSSS